MAESVEESIEGRRGADDDEENKPKALGQERAAIVRKLLTETKIPQPQTNFVRGTAASRSCRVESKKGDSLQYITDQYKTQVLIYFFTKHFDIFFFCFTTLVFESSLLFFLYCCRI